MCIIKNEKWQLPHIGTQIVLRPSVVRRKAEPLHSFSPAFLFVQIFQKQQKNHIDFLAADIQRTELSWLKQLFLYQLIYHTVLLQQFIRKADGKGKLLNAS